VAIAVAAAGAGTPRVVVQLEFVPSLGSRAVAVLVAHAMRLAKAGGGLRLARPQPAVRARLDWLRLPLIVPLFDTLDEAVLRRWDDAA
jgi:anti-anti-sigma factor